MIAQVTPRFKEPRGPRPKNKTTYYNRAGNDRSYLVKIRNLPSCISGLYGCEPHHLRYANERGVGMKATDRWAIPLTREEHLEVHRVGSRKEARWFLDRGVDAYQLAHAMWSNRHSQETMLNILKVHCKWTPKKS